MSIAKDKIEILLDAWDYCDEQDKSTEYMLVYMSNMSGLDYDTVVGWMGSIESTKARYERHKDTELGKALKKQIDDYEK